MISNYGSGLFSSIPVISEQCVRRKSRSIANNKDSNPLFINCAAVLARLPNGGFPIIITFSRDGNSVDKSSKRKSLLTMPPQQG